MSFVLKECLDKEPVTVIVGNVRETRPQLSFLQGLNFSYYETRKQSL